MRDSLPRYFYLVSLFFVALNLQRKVKITEECIAQAFPSVHEGFYTCRATNALTTIEAKVRIHSPVSAASCSVIRKYVSSVSRNYVIDPDGEGGLAPFIVFCDMIDKRGVGVTVVSHDSESRTLVYGYGSPGSYSRDIHYTGASLSWRVSPESPHTASSLSSMSVIIQFCFTITIHTDGGCHVILLR